MKKYLGPFCVGFLPSTACFSGEDTLMGLFMLDLGEVCFLQFETLTHSLLLVLHTRLLFWLPEWKRVI